MLIEEVMTKEVITCAPGDTVESIVRLMSEKDISGVPVTENGRLVGMITEEDIMKILSVPEKSTTLWLPSPLEVLLEIPFKELLQLRNMQRTLTDVSKATVKGVMSKNVQTIAPDDDIENAAEIMVRYKINRLPVIKDGSIVGIVTRDDIIHSLAGGRK